VLRITDTMAVEDREIRERFVRAMGPDGQNASRHATAVELRLDIARSSLPSEVKQRLLALGGRHVTKGGVVVIVSRKYRSQAQNREAARTILTRLLLKGADVFVAPVARKSAGRSKKGSR